MSNLEESNSPELTEPEKKLSAKERAEQARIERQSFHGGDNPYKRNQMADNNATQVKQSQWGTEKKW